MIVKFLNIKIENFKSIENLEIEFHDVTRIFGANESGKTSVADAISWVLTGKNSLGDSTFNIIPINSVGISPTVELKLSIDDKKPTLKRVLKAKIGRDKQFTGEYATECYVNGVKCTQRDFEKWIADNICDPEIFKLIHDVRYFTENISTNGKERPWEARRRLLTSICEIEHDNQLALLDERFKPIYERLPEFDDTSQLLTRIKSEIADAERELSNTNARIGQYERFEFNKTVSVDGNNKQELNARLNAISQKWHKIKDKYDREVKERDEVARDFGKKLVQAGKEIFAIQAKIQKAEMSLSMAKENYEKYGVACPTCGRKFARGFSDQKKEEYDKTVSELSVKISLLRDELKNAEDNQNKIESAYKNALYQQRVDRPDELRELEAMAAELSAKIATIEHREKEIEKFESGIKREHKERDELSAKLSLLQADMDLTKDFINYKAELVERKVNELFDGVEIRMFHQNKNGEIRDCCEILHRGVSYENLSYSEKYLCSLSIALAFQKHFSVSVPLLVDNSESIFCEYHDDVQVISLVAVESVCPKCGKKIGRRKSNGNWFCGYCEWDGRLELEVC